MKAVPQSTYTASPMRVLSAIFLGIPARLLLRQIGRQLTISLLLTALLAGGLRAADAAQSDVSPQNRVQQTTSPGEMKAEVRSLPIKKQQVVFGLAGGERHLYTIQLKAGELLHLVVEQRGIDVVLSLYGPGDKKLREVDSPNGSQGPEPLGWVAETTGSYRLEVRSPEQNAKAGQYAIRDVELRQATARDRKFVTADQSFVEGQRLRLERDEKSWRVALSNYQAALTLWGELGEHGKEAQTLYWIGRLHLRLHELKNAVEALTQALTIYRAGKDKEAEADTLYHLGLAHAKAGLHNSALDSYQQALEVCRTIRCDFEAIILENTGPSYEKVGDGQKALGSYRQAALVYHNTGKSEDEARMLSIIGGMLEDLSNQTEAIEVYTQILSLRRKLQDRKGEFSALMKLGRVYSDSGQPQKGLDFCRQALAVAKDAADQFDTSLALFNIGLKYQKLGDQEKALETFNQVLPQVTGENRAILLSGMARSHYLSGDRRRALAVYQQALAEGNNWPGKKEAEKYVKEIEEENKAEEELKTVEQGLVERRAAKDLSGEALALERAGALQLKIKELRRAAETFDRLTTLQQTLGQREREADALHKLGLIHIVLREGEKGQELLSQSLKIYREIGDRREEQDILEMIKEVEKAAERAPAGTGSLSIVKAYEAVGDSKARRVFDMQALAYLNQMEWLSVQRGQEKLKHRMAEPSYSDSEKRDAANAELLGNLAGELSLEERWPQALERYQELLELQRQNRYRSGEAETLFQMGRVYFAMGEHPRAVETYAQALALRRQLHDQKGEAETLVAIGVVQNLQGDRPKALEYYQQALSLQNAINDQRGQAITLFRLGEVYFLLGEKQKALDSLNQSLLKGGAEREGLALNYTEEYQNIRRRLEAASVKGGDQSTQNKEGFGHSRTLQYIGLIYASLGQPQKEQEYYREALRQAQGALAVIRVGKKTGFRESIQDDPEMTRRYLMTERSAEGTTLITQGEAYYRLGQKREALESFNQALQFLNDVGYLNSEANRGTYFGIASIVNLLDVGTLRDEAYVLNRVGLINSSLGDHQRALEALKRSLALCRERGNRDRQAEVLHNIGTVYESLGDIRQAVENYSQALILRRELKDAEGEGETLDRLMRLWKSLNQRRLAVFYGKQAVNAFQQIRSHIQGLDKELQRGFLISRADTYRQLADLLIGDGRLPEAQQILELLKQEEYAEFVRGETTGGPDVAANLNPEEAGLLRRYTEIENRVIAISRESVELSAKQSRTAEEEQLVKKLDEDLQAANVAFEKFLSSLPTEFAGAQKGAVNAALKAAELRAAQELSATLREIGPGAVVLYTILAPDKYHIILFTSETQVARSYPITADDLNRKIHQFRVALRNPKYDPLPLAQELHRIVVGPVAKDLEAAKADTLMWELDGTLRYLPMAALHDGRQYLVEKYRNSVFTPASQSRLERSPAEKWRGLGLGVSKSAVPLPFVADELRGIIRDTTLGDNAGVVDGRIMLDDSFTKDGMKTALVREGGYSLVHIASHFIFKPGNETDSYLLLGGGGADSDEARHLTLAEIKRSPNLFRGVELLTLSACNTAVGEGASGAGTEVENFGVLAQLKGARAVIATLWHVNDSSTMFLMKSFYRLRNESPSTPKIEALRQAQLSLLRGGVKGASSAQLKRDNSKAETSDDWEEQLPRFKPDPDKPYAHPYYWAPFILIGNWR